MAPTEAASSQHAHAGEGASQSRQLLEDKFSARIAELDGEPGRKLAPSDFQKFFSDTLARVQLPGEDHPQLLISSAPLRTESADGSLEPVNLDVHAAGGHFEAQNPLVPLTMPADAAGQLRLQDSNVGIRLDSSDASQAAGGELDGDKVFYHEAATDTDLIEAPVAQGGEVFAQLRSVDSPEALHFHVDLPSGAALAELQGQGLEITGSGGDRLTLIDSPSAVDAGGNAIATNLQKTGPDSFDLVVEHRSADTVYPILVDPLIEDWYNNSWAWSGNGNTQGWTTQGTGFFPHNSCWWYCWGNPPYNGRYMSAESGQGVSNGEWTQWAYQVPGQTTYIRTFGFDPFYFANGSDNAGNPYVYWGTYSGACACWTYYNATGVAFAGRNDWHDLYAPGSPTPPRTDSAIFGLGDNTNRTLTANRSADLGGMYITIDDPENPSVSASPSSGAQPFSSWLPEYHATSTYADKVLGDQPLLYWRLGETTGTAAADSSGNTRAGIYTGGATLHAHGAVSDGDNTGGAVDLDGSSGYVSSTYSPFQNGTTRSFEGWANRDTSTTADALFGASNTNSAYLRLQAGSNNVQFTPQSTSGPYTTWTNAWPGNNQWVHWVLVFNEATDSASLYINGALVSTQTNSAAYNASPGNIWSGGRVGTSDPFDGKLDEVAVYDHALSAAKIEDHYASGPTGIGWVTANGSDPGVGVSSLKLTYTTADGSQATQTQDASYPCSGTRQGGVCYSPRVDDLPFNTNSASLPEGINTMTVTATDALGKSTPSTFDARVDRSSPAMQLTGGLYSQTAPGYDLHVAATDGNAGTHSSADRANARSGMRRIELFIDGGATPLATTGNQPCTDSWGSCPLALDFTLNPQSYSEGDHTFKVVATDQLGHQNSTQWTQFVENTPPNVTSLSGTMTEGWLTDGTKSVSVNASDAGAGVSKIALDIPGVQDSDGAVDLDGNSQYISSSYSNGPNLNGPNLLPNPSFETDTSGWWTWGDASNPSVTRTGDATAPDGANVALVNANGGQTYQLLATNSWATTVGQTYTGSMWVKAPAGYSMCEQIYEAGGVGSTGNCWTASGNWEQKSVTRLIGSATSADLRLFASNAPAGSFQFRADAASVTQATNLLNNPSFEADTANWWTWGDVSNPSVARTTDATAPDGARVALVTANGAQTYQTLGTDAWNTKVGQTYTGSIWVKGPAGYSMCLQMLERGSNANTINCWNASGGWERKTVTRTITSNNSGTDLRLFASNAPAGSFQFRADAATVTIGPSPDLGPFVNGTTRTFEGWASRDTNTNGNTLISGSDGTREPWLKLMAAGNDVRFKPDESGASTSGVTWANAWPGNNQWVHWALVFNEAADSASLYINGSLISTQVVKASYSVTPGSFQSGTRDVSGAPTDYFDGKLDEVAVYDRGLSAGQIREHYLAGAAYAGLVQADSPSLYWRLGENSGTTASDSSGNGHTGTYIGAPTLNATGAITTFQTEHLEHRFTCDPRCPTQPTASWSLPVSSLAEGVQTLTAKAYGPGGETSAPRTAQIKVDRTPAYITAVTGPAGWLRSGTSTISASAENPIAGVDHLTLDLPGGQSMSHSFDCSSGCPASVTYDFGFDPTTLPDGTGEGVVHAYGPGGVASQSGRGTIKIDHTAPDLSASGPLFDAPGSSLGATADSPVQVNDQGSGLSTIQLAVDGTTVDTKQLDDFSEDAQTCNAGSCSFSGDDWFDLTGVSPGSHDVRLTATDLAGNTDSVDGSIVLDPNSPSISVSGLLADLDGQPLTQDTASASISVTDGAAGDSGVQALTLSMDGQQVAQYPSSCSPSCPASVQQDYEYQRSIWGAGPHDLTISATDAAGNQAERVITIDQQPEQATTTCGTHTPTTVTASDPLPASQVAADLQAEPDSPVAPTIPSGDDGSADGINDQLDPTLVPPPANSNEPDPNIESAGVPVDSAASSSPGTGVKIGDLCIQPQSTTDAETGAYVVPDDSGAGDAAVYANSGPQVDTVYRPTPAGGALVVNSRGADAPDTFSWTIDLDPGEHLEQLGSGGIAIVDTTVEDPPACTAPPAPAGGDTLAELPDTATQEAQSEHEVCAANNEIDDGLVTAVIAPPVSEDGAGNPLPVTLSYTQIPDVPPAITFEFPPDLPNKKMTLLRADLGYDPKDCIGVPSPCGAYNAAEAVQYATRWGGTPNPAFHDYGSNDCTNFMSQSLWAGNVQRMREFDFGKGSWWVQRPTFGAQEDTNSWTVADDLARHLWQYGLVKKVSHHPSDFQGGDLIAINWEWGPNGAPPGDPFDHFQIVTRGGGGGQPAQMAQHSVKDYSGYTWPRVVDRITDGTEDHAAEGRLWQGWGYIVLRPIHSAANIGAPVHSWGSL